MMAPILEELAAEYKGQMEVVFIDVWKDRAAGAKYGIRAIPTQIFYAADGRELFRHTGFYPKADILAKWRELGVELKATETPAK
jgi:thioredoxin 1